MKKIYTIVHKNGSLHNLLEYFKSLKEDEIYYYINPGSSDLINFLEENIYDREDIELCNFVINHLKIALKKIIKMDDNVFNIDIKNIKISFISDLIYYEDVFVIKDIIYINYLYIKRVFYDLEENNYSNINQIYISYNNIYDKSLIKTLFKNLIYLSQNKNSNLWIKKLLNYINSVEESLQKFEIIDINQFIIDYEVIKNPSTFPINNKIFVFKINNKYYCSLNVIVSSKSYSPYYDNKSFQVIKKNDKYILNDNVPLYLDIPSNIFEYIANSISNNTYNNINFSKKDEI